MKRSKIFRCVAWVVVSMIAQAALGYGHDYLTRVIDGDTSVNAAAFTAVFLEASTEVEISHSEGQTIESFIELFSRRQNANAQMNAATDQEAKDALTSALWTDFTGTMAARLQFVHEVMMVESAEGLKIVMQRMNDRMKVEERAQGGCYTRVGRDEECQADDELNVKYGNGNAAYVITHWGDEAQWVWKLVALIVQGSRIGSLTDSMAMKHLQDGLLRIEDNNRKKHDCWIHGSRGMVCTASESG